MRSASAVEQAPCAIQESRTRPNASRNSAAPVQNRMDVREHLRQPGRLPVVGMAVEQDDRHAGGLDKVRTA